MLIFFGRLFVTRLKLDNNGFVATPWFPHLSIYNDVIMKEIDLHDIVVCQLVLLN